ncbi:MAG: hypothetical protein U5L45_11060 [Saprospiraceae bacterium]|nr:hypothetical protein [Saprospiraceae bacterium]
MWFIFRLCRKINHLSSFRFNALKKTQTVFSSKNQRLLFRKNLSLS